MQKYEILEHPAELRIRVYGEALEELFSNAAFAMGEILNSNPNVPNGHPNYPNKEKVKIQSIDLNSLLVDFLSEALAKSQINKCVYEVADGQIAVRCHPERRLVRLAEAKDLINKGKNGNEILHSVQNDRKECFLEAELIGYPVDKFDEDIKAVTYEDLDIKKVDGHWETMVVFDI